MEFTPETARLLLQNKFDRIENLVKINHEFTMGVPTVIAAIWGIGLNHGNNVLIFCVITIALLLIWRYFAHYIDNAIAETYIQVIDLETELEVPRDLALYHNLINGIWVFQYKNEAMNNNKLCEIL